MIGLIGQESGGDENTAAAAGVGGAVGAATGLVLGLGALTVPGVGPIVATGWFLSGAVTGALAGGVLGALVDAGVPEKDAERHASDHARGRSVVSVRVQEPDVALATRILDAAWPLELAEEPPQQDVIKVVS